MLRESCLRQLKRDPDGLAFIDFLASAEVAEVLGLDRTLNEVAHHANRNKAAALAGEFGVEKAEGIVAKYDWTLNYVADVRARTGTGALPV